MSGATGRRSADAASLEASWRGHVSFVTTCIGIPAIADALDTWSRALPEGR